MSKFQAINSSGELDYPKVLPTLDLNFAQERALDPRITFTRSSGGTYVDQDGLIKTAGVNQPRFDHDPVTGECRGLLVEESRTNIRTNSATAFFPVVGNYTFAGTSNDIIAPDGSNTTYKVISSGALQTTLDVGYLQVGLTAGVTYTVSAYYYATGDTTNSRNIGIQVFGNGGASTTFTLPQRVWSRQSLTFTAGSTSSTGQIRIISNDFGAFNTVSGATVYLWGAQIEQGAFPTSYIPTAGSTLTRAADNVAITGTNFSSFYNQSEGTVFIDYIRFPINVNYYPAPWIIRDSIPGAYINGIQVFGEAGNTYDRLGGTNISNTPAVTLSNPYSRKDKNAAAFKSGDLNMAINGVLGTKSGNDIYAYGTVNQLQLGQSFTIKQFTYYPKRLSDNTLRRLTE